jgi:hypothetical protein
MTIERARQEDISAPKAEAERSMPAEVHPEAMCKAHIHETKRDLEIRLNEALTLADIKIDAIEELQIKYDDLMRQYQELLEVERLRTSKSDFKSAAVLPKHAWVAAIDALNFYSVLNKASRWAIEHNDPWKKILFDIKEDGQLKAAKLEGDVT